MVRQQGLFIILCGIAWCGFVSFAEQPEALFSESGASDFVNQASSVYQEDPLDPERIVLAMTLLEAAYSLDNNAKSIPEQMLRAGAGSCYAGPDYSNVLMWALDRYLGSHADLEVAFGALRCMLERLNSRLDREVLLERLVRKYSGSNPAFASELATQLALLASEKSDVQSGVNYLAAAYQMNPYNRLAYSTLTELMAGSEQSIKPSAEVLYMRNALTVNPYDLDMAVQYANALQRLQLYSLASAAYEYAAQVHDYLYPDQALPEEILHSWLLSCYHADRSETKCLKVANTYRDPKRFDLMLEAVVGKMLIRLGQVESGNRTLEKATQKAEALLSGQSSAMYPEYLAWFNSFVVEQPEKALAWGNQAYQEDPNRPGVQLIFAYCLAANGQVDLAQQYVESLEDNDPIALLTTAIAQLSGDQKQQGLESLKAAIEIAPESFVAEKAMKLLDEQGSSYIPSISADSVRQELEQNTQFGLVPKFSAPSDRYSIKLLFNGSDFLYGADFPARLVIENTSSEPLVISDDGLINGNLRIDVTLKGKINVAIKNLLAMKFRPSQPIAPGQHYSVPLNLNRGRLRKLLLTYPQADVQIAFDLYLDPQEGPSDQQGAAITAKKSIQAQIHRRGVVLSRDFLMQRLDVLSKGQQGQKYQAATLFTGLLAEQKAFELSQADYDHVQIERILLKDSIRKILADNDWKIRLHTLNCLLSLSMPLDHGVIGEISENLNHEKWPVRFAALYLLAKAQPDSFQKVLDWTAQHDPVEMNRKMALALGANVPESVAEKTEPEFQE